MPAELPPGVEAGAIYLHPRFYTEKATGEFKSKYLVVLAALQVGDIVFRLLTSRPHGRPERPPCNHGDPYPSFYLGVLGNGLSQKSWLDLRQSDDLDADEFSTLLVNGTLTLASRLPRAVLRAAMECAAGAPDTTTAQERAIRDRLAGV